MSLHILDHPKLGCVRGIEKYPLVTQYLGIQYASLHDRFSRAKLLESLPNDHIRRDGGVFDATQNGPIPLLPPNACETEQSIMIQKVLPATKVVSSDTEGLTLNISVPTIQSTASLPVFVFVHGGGWMTGSTVYPQYDLGLLTKLSWELGTPMVSVGINYRTGAAGFLYSSVMQKHGYKANNGLGDQRVALRWIKRNIAGFGGDPNRITFAGESAGAVSGWFHLQSPEPLFSQFISMSGSSFIRPRPLSMLEKSFSMLAVAIGAGKLSRDEQLMMLLQVDQEEFAAKPVPVGPIFDGDLIRTNTTFKDLTEKQDLESMFPAIRHCKRLVMGDCQMDGTGFYNRIKARTEPLAKSLAQCLAAVFDPVDVAIAPALVSAYSLDPTTTSNSQQTLKMVLEFLGDALFALPARYLTQAWSCSNIPNSKAYLYHFNSPNPWDGPWKGHATHALDIAFVLQNYGEHLTEGQRQCSQRFAKDLVAFVNEADPWPSFQKDVAEGSMIYNTAVDGNRDLSEFVLGRSPGRTGRRDLLMDLVGEELLDKLVEACSRFLVA